MKILCLYGVRERAREIQICHTRLKNVVFLYSAITGICLGPMVRNFEEKEIFLLYRLTHPYSHVHSVLLGTIVSNSLNRIMYIIKPLGFRKKSRPIKIQNSKHLLSTKND